MFTLLAAVVFGFSINASADNHEGPTSGVAETWVVTVDMGSQAAFEEAFKTHMAVREEAGDPANWQVYTNHTGSNMNTYYIRNCCSQWADFDAYRSWEEENANVMADWGANVHPHTSNYGHHYSMVDYVNSHWPGDTEHKFVGVTTYEIAPGSGQAFDAAKAELSQAALTGGWSEAGHRWAWSSAVDGENSVSLAIPHENFADMAEPDPTLYQFMSKHMGSEEAASESFARFTAAISGSSYKIYAHRPDLSMSMSDE